MPLNKETKPDSDTDLIVIFNGVLQGNTLAPYMLFTNLD